MSFIKAYLKGIWRMFASKRIWAIHYFLLVLIAAISTLPLFDLIQSSIGQSLELEHLLSGFDFTVYSDFMNHPGVKSALPAIMSTSTILLVLFVLLMVFLTGGVLSVYRDLPAKYSLTTFFAGCTQNFWRILRLTIYFLAIHVLLFLLFGMIYQTLTAGGIKELESEVGYINILKILIPIYLFVASIFFMVQDYAKIHAVYENKAFLFRPFWESFGITFRHFFRTYPLYLLNLLTFLGFTYLFYYLNTNFIADNTDGIALAFAVGQGFILSRIGLRLMNLASATYLYKYIRHKEGRDAAPVEQVQNEVLTEQAIAQNGVTPPDQIIEESFILPPPPVNWKDEEE